MNVLKPLQNALTSIMPLPKTYKAVVLEKAGAPWDLKEVSLEEPQQGQILIKVEACGVCHSDSAVQEGHMGLVEFIIRPSLFSTD